MVYTPTGQPGKVQLFCNLLSIFYIGFHCTLGIFDRGTQRNKPWNFPRRNKTHMYIAYNYIYTYASRPTIKPHAIIAWSRNIRICYCFTSFSSPVQNLGPVSAVLGQRPHLVDRIKNRSTQYHFPLLPSCLLGVWRETLGGGMLVIRRWKDGL